MAAGKAWWGVAAERPSATSYQAPALACTDTGPLNLQKYWIASVKTKQKKAPRFRELTPKRYFYSS
jgi:hypothetical protein